MRTKYPAAAMLFTVAAVSAQEAPLQGLLHSTVDGSSLTYDCQPVVEGKLTCMMARTEVLKYLQVAEIPEKLVAAEKVFDTLKPLTAEQCQPVRELLEVLEGKRPPSDPQAFAEATPEVRERTLRSTRNTLAYCDSPGLENYRGMVQSFLENEARTCTITSIPRTETYTLLSKPEESPLAVWGYSSPPDAACGVVRHAYWESAVNDETGEVVWRYVVEEELSARTEATTVEPACAARQGSSYSYEPAKKVRKLDCEMVIYGAPGQPAAYFPF